MKNRIDRRNSVKSKNLGLKPHIPIGLKIFGIAASMLGLLLLVVYVSSNRLKQVSKEIEALAEYIIPITDAVAKVNVHALEQEVLFERTLKHYEQEPIDSFLIAQEIAEFEQRNAEVDYEFGQIQRLMSQAVNLIAMDSDRQDLQLLLARLGSVKQQHQEFHAHAVQIIERLDAGQWDTARTLALKLAKEEEAFDRSIEEILIELEAFTVASAQAGQQHQQQVQQFSVAIALLATAVGGTFAWTVALGLVQPVRTLTQNMKAIQDGDFDAQVKISSQDEVGTLATAFNHMAQELQAKNQLEETFGKYVDPRVVKQLLNATDTTTTTGDRQVMTVFFAEVEGFSAAAETLAPDESVAVTNQYCTLMARPISEQSGVIDKFINATVMGFWGPPFANTLEHADRACAAALEQLTQLSAIQASLNHASLNHASLPHTRVDSSASSPKLHLRVGIATGALVVGNMGSNSAKSYTVMGDTVNTASRLKGVSKQYGVAIALTEETKEMVGDRYETRELDLIKVVGKDEPVRVYELLGLRGGLQQFQYRRQEQFAKGLAVYRQQRWDSAQEHFRACSTDNAPDPPALLYLDRIQKLRQTPPPADWDGVWQMTKK